ncbi:MAG: phosphodiester glycosidase family protein [Bdellovibrionales bacterium]|nr:phosphodiester glycosidase family protein [Bdellovibrionales bacterium]
MRRLAALLALGLLLPAAAAADGESPTPVTYQSWQDISHGIALKRIERKSPRLVGYLLRVEISLPEITVFVTPGNGAEPKDAAARNTTEAFNDFNCAAAINGSVFKPLPSAKGDPVDILGLAISSGEKYSEPNKFDAILFPSQQRGLIAKPPFNTTGIRNALAGYHIILDQARVLPSSDKRHPRTAVGLSKQGGTLYMLVIDGRLPGYSDGATLAETATILARAGAYNGLNMDGGGSTAMVIRDENGQTKRLNQPSGGLERRVGNHLCIRSPMKYRH